MWTAFDPQRMGTEGSPGLMAALLSSSDSTPPHPNPTPAFLGSPGSYCLSLFPSESQSPQAFSGWAAGSLGLLCSPVTRTAQRSWASPAPGRQALLCAEPCTRLWDPVEEEQTQT